MSEKDSKDSSYDKLKEKTFGGFFNLINPGFGSPDNKKRAAQNPKGNNLFSINEKRALCSEKKPSKTNHNKRQNSGFNGLAGLFGGATTARATTGRGTTERSLIQRRRSSQQLKEKIDIKFED